ncbi:MAG: hypothetical protein ABI882_15515, partial [Acidobacteriota bacterium]
MERRLLLTAALVTIVLSVTSLGQRPRTIAETESETSVTAPVGTIIWIDRLRYGKVPESGSLPIKNIGTGSHTLRSRL